MFLSLYYTIPCPTTHSTLYHAKQHETAPVLCTRTRNCRGPESCSPRFPPRGASGWRLPGGGLTVLVASDASGPHRREGWEPSGQSLPLPVLYTILYPTHGILRGTRPCSTLLYFTIDTMLCIPWTLQAAAIIGLLKKVVNSSAEKGALCSHCLLLSLFLYPNPVPFGFNAFEARKKARIRREALPALGES